MKQSTYNNKFIWSTIAMIAITFGALFLISPDFFSNTSTTYLSKISDQNNISQNVLGAQIGPSITSTISKFNIIKTFH